VTAAAVPRRGIDDRIQRLDHIAIAVEDMSAARDLFVGLLGAQFLNGGDNRSTGARLVHLAFGGAIVELMAPLRGDSALSRHLERRGTGFHHMTFVVDDVPRTIDDLDGLGVQVRGTKLDPHHWRETFLSPRDTFGALIQFADTDLDWHTPTDDYDFADVLAGRVEWIDAVACLRS
jgi:methylmalonyl-CoA/ethylmalonyl-CoA epimerase